MHDEKVNATIPKINSLFINIIVLMIYFYLGTHTKYTIRINSAV